MPITLEAVYADGWNGAVVNPMSRSAAAVHDAAGDPYAVLLLDRGRVRARVHVSWRTAYCHLAGFDSHGNTIATCELRGPDLAVYETRTWVGPADVSAFEFPHIAARHHTRYMLDGRRLDVDEPRGDRAGAQESESIEAPPRHARPMFGEIATLLHLIGIEDAAVVDATGHGLPVVSASNPPWRPPLALPPGNPDTMFVDGEELVVDGRALRVEVHHAGMLRLPTGRLVAADPSSLDIARPYLAMVAPGVYPVSVSMVRVLDDPRHTRVLAARLHVTDRPVASWAMALCANHDPRLLGYGQFFGFGVDVGVACFVDAEECERLEGAWRHLGGLVEPRYAVVDGGAMVAWSSGWGDGSYPTWIGRDAAGEVACFVADMQVIPRHDQAEYDPDE